MTYTVKVTAHCADDKVVHVVKQNAAGTVGETLNLKNGDSWEVVVYDDFTVNVSEFESKPGEVPQA